MSEEKKMTDEEIVKALEHCLHGRPCEYCYHNDEVGSGEIVCRSRIMGKALDLIHRLQSENAEWHKDYIALDLEARKLQTELDKELSEHEEFTKKAKEEIIEWNKLSIEQKAKIERLTKENSNVISMNDALYREKAELQKQVDELENRFENKACCNMSENCSMVRQAVKYTAREILTELKNTRFHKGTLTYDFEMALNKIAEKYSVEVK